MNARMSSSPLKRFSNKSSLTSRGSSEIVGRQRTPLPLQRLSLQVVEALDEHLRMFKGSLDIMSSRDFRASHSLALLRAISNPSFNIC
jgi:hypothetical protein